MKINKIYLAITILATVLLVACNEYEDTVVPSPAVPEGCQGVYFPSSNAQVFELEPTEPTQITLAIAREVSSGAVDVPVNVEINNDEVFNVPAKVSFADGDTLVNFTVTFPSAAEGTTYNLKLTVDGDTYVNPYSSGLTYMTLNVTRIKWEPVTEPMVYVDGAFTAGYGVSIYPMYVEAEKAQLGESVRYRFKNAYGVPTQGADEDGIYDGYPYTEPGDFDTSKDYYTIVEIYDPAGKSGDVFMYANEIGVDWGYGMITIGSFYENVSTDLSSYPLGTLKDGVITFPANSLYFSEANYNDGQAYPSSTPTYIYLTKDAYIAANLKIDDFNAVEYEEIAGEVGEFESAAYSESWNQTLSKAIDMDPENEDSDYKNLYYLADLYAQGYGVAFYYEEGKKIKIPENQPTGRTAFGQDVYVSPSDSIESSVEVNSKGVTIYTLGLTFHYSDGTILGDFAEKFYYSENAVSYSKEDFLGNFVMTGPSQFSGEDDANMDVTIAEGDAENTLVITGIDYAGEIMATFDPASSVMSITPQLLPDFVASSGTYDMTLYTTDSQGYSETAILNLTFNMQGNLVATSTSQADGYLIYSSAVGGWVDGYYNLVFTPDNTKSASIAERSITSTPFAHSYLAKRIKETGNNFKIQRKISPKTRKTTSGPAIY